MNKKLIEGRTVINYEEKTNTVKITLDDESVLEIDRNSYRLLVTHTPKKTEEELEEERQAFRDKIKSVQVNRKIVVHKVGTP